MTTKAQEEAKRKLTLRQRLDKPRATYGRWGPHPKAELHRAGRQATLYYHRGSPPTPVAVSLPGLLVCTPRFTSTRVYQMTHKKCWVEIVPFPEPLPDLAKEWINSTLGPKPVFLSWRATHFED